MTGPGIYLHIPFCVRRCGYCSFNSRVADARQVSRYVAALNDEISLHRPDFTPGTLYVGGGTPTVAEPAGLAGAIRKASTEFCLPRGSEVTLEANPATLDGYGIETLLDAGVNRVSLGAQSFDDAELVRLGRVHGSGEIKDSVNLLRRLGVDNISLDLIYSVPGQDMATWTASLETALELGPEHISVYCLSVEEGTPFYERAAAGDLALPPESLQVEMYGRAVELLEKAGLARYEISNFSRPGRQCAHNLNYWAAGDFLGLGAGAHSSVRGVRTVNIHEPLSYIRAVGTGRLPFTETERVSGEDARREFIMLSLRTSAGLSLDEYLARFGRPFLETYAGETSRLEQAGCLVSGRGRLRLTDRGIFASNAVISEFF